jgi:hypothetical protein
MGHVDVEKISPSAPSKIRGKSGVEPFRLLGPLIDGTARGIDRDRFGAVSRLAVNFGFLFEMNQHGVPESRAYILVRD